MQVVKILEVARCFRTRFIASWLVVPTQEPVTETTETHLGKCETFQGAIADEFMVPCLHLFVGLELHQVKIIQEAV